MFTKENTTKINSHLPKSSDHWYRILAIDGSGWGKTNSLLNLMDYQPNIDKI